MFLWNVFVGIIVTGLLSLIVVLWFLIVAPFQYVVFLVAGAPVRMGLSGAPLRTILDDESDPDQQTIAVVEDARKPPKYVLDVSFTRKPFTLTSAIAAILLWLRTMLLVASFSSIASSRYSCASRSNSIGLLGGKSSLGNGFMSSVSPIRERSDRAREKLA
jgi:hypothetical protein